MKIKIKDIFPILLQGFPVTMNSLEIADIVNEHIPGFPYTKRTTQEYLNRFKSGNTPTISKTRGEIKVELDEGVFTDLGFNNLIFVENSFLEAANEMLSIEEVEEDVTAEDETPAVNIQDAKADFGPQRWLRDDADYTWVATGGKQLSVKLSLLDDIFFHYSKHGMNWTRSKVCRKFDINPKVFRSLIAAFELSKDSNIYAPHVPEDLTAAELDAYVGNRMKKVFTSGERVEEKYADAVNKAHLKVVDESILTKIEIEEFLGEIAENINVLPTEIKYPVTVTYEKGEVVIGLADLHIGAEVDNIQRSQDFSTEILTGYLTSVAEHVNKMGFERVKIVIAGDLIEGGPDNHPNSFKGTQRGIYWGYQLILATKVLTDFFQKVYNLKSVHIVGGNHDRATGSNKGDTESTYAAAIVYFLEEMYKDKVDFQYHYDTIDFEALGAHFIVAHGDRGFHKRNVSEIILAHGDPNKYNVILMGHWHSLQIPNNADHTKYIKMHLPGLYTGNEYSSSAGFSSLPGFAIFEQGSINRSIVDFKIIRL